VLGGHDFPWCEDTPSFVMKAFRLTQLSTYNKERICCGADQHALLLLASASLSCYWESRTRPRLGGHYSTESTLEVPPYTVAQRLDQLSASYDQQAVFGNHHLDLGPSVSFASYTSLLEKATQNPFSLPSLPLSSHLQQAIASTRSAAWLAPQDNWPLQEMPHTISTSPIELSEMLPEFQAGASISTRTRPGSLDARAFGR